jgi:hypothetical protein
MLVGGPQRFRGWYALRLERISRQPLDRDAGCARQFKCIDEPFDPPLFNPGIRIKFGCSSGNGGRAARIRAWRISGDRIRNFVLETVLLIGQRL